jgi:FixJ family two-component response regulator
MAIANVDGGPEVAPVLGISEETVRTRLKRIFEKTDTSRQADLVKLVTACKGWKAANKIAST